MNQDADSDYLATHCRHCGSYVDPMDSEAVIRDIDGTEVWCNEGHAAAWIVEQSRSW